MTRRTELTKAEHLEFGRGLKSVRLTINSFINRYLKSSKEIMQFKALEKAIDAVRCTMDSEIYRKLPREDHTAINYYYGADPEISRDDPRMNGSGRLTADLYEAMGATPTAAERLVKELS
jgi:hypothetical protein